MFGVRNLPSFFVNYSSCLLPRLLSGDAGCCCLFSRCLIDWVKGDLRRAKKNALKVAGSVD